MPKLTWFCVTLCMTFFITLHLSATPETSAGAAEGLLPLERIIPSKNLEYRLITYSTENKNHNAELVRIYIQDGFEASPPIFMGHPPCQVSVTTFNKKQESFLTLFNETVSGFYCQIKGIGIFLNGLKNEERSTLFSQTFLDFRWHDLMSELLDALLGDGIDVRRLQHFQTRKQKPGVLQQKSKRKFVGLSTKSPKLRSLNLESKTSKFGKHGPPPHTGKLQTKRREL